jgi:hypothetical protein
MGLKHILLECSIFSLGAVCSSSARFRNNFKISRKSSTPLKCKV